MDYLNLAKYKKRMAKKICRAIKQLQYIRMGMGYVEAFVADGVELIPKAGGTVVSVPSGLRTTAVHL